MTLYTAHATTFDNVNLQYEVKNGFQSFKGDVQIFNSYEEALEAAQFEQKQYPAIKSIEIKEVDLDA